MAFSGHLVWLTPKIGLFPPFLAFLLRLVGCLKFLAPQVVFFSLAFSVRAGAQ